MVRVISQKTYDDVVKENIEELSMEPQEAIADAIAQFEAQGVDLSNIVKDLIMTDQGVTSQITSALRFINDLLTDYKYAADKEILCNLKVLSTECKKDIAHRLLAANENAYNTILLCLSKCSHNDDIVTGCIEALISLMDGQPDLLDDQGVAYMIEYLTEPKESPLKSLILQWVYICCLKHEMNRQKIFNSDILQCLKSMLPKADKQGLKDICAVLRALCLDDDVRVEFGQAHEHARVIASDTLCSITSLLAKFRMDEQIVSELMLTLSALLVRHEFCQMVVDCGGLRFILDSMVEFGENYKVIKQSFKLLKALAGNDDVKLQIIKNGGDNIIASSLEAHKKNEGTVVSGLACVSALTLRAPSNSKAFYDNAIPQIIATCMEMHRNSLYVQKMASWAIRNMVSRAREQCETFKRYGVEKFLNENITKFPDCEYDFKAALRDLGCDVKLKEEWTGKGGKIQTAENKDGTSKDTN
ncbi:armadillo repeat-containing protein 6 homolog [Ctenocephalides felis]|uniref:armadillo repeat-containing protein 6 homolog n=1 Tax=Ctenocephalides felis TaxID=7515 RepID=UPI000E6E1C6A|nr:armadillo repeat-containing protein 6 homolog [Ctenocephalides felis]